MPIVSIIFSLIDLHGLPKTLINSLSLSPLPLSLSLVLFHEFWHPPTESFQAEFGLLVIQVLYDVIVLFLVNFKNDGLY